jgi:hypothetical protein
MRSTNEIVPAWPFALKRGTVEEEKLEVWRLAASGLNGWERYVEWVKI